MDVDRKVGGSNVGNDSGTLDNFGDVGFRDLIVGSGKARDGMEEILEGDEEVEVEAGSLEGKNVGFALAEINFEA